MHDDYTPTTDEVRDGYATDPESEYYDPIGYPAYARGLRRAFDRWLAAHDREVAERAAQRVRDYWDACGELIDSNNGARLAFEAVAAQIVEAG